MVIVVSWLVMCAGALAGVVALKSHDQAGRDKNRRTYRLSFPAELNTKQVLAWIRSISGTLQTGHVRLTGVPTLAFELWSSPSGLVHRIRVPWQHADYVISQLRSLIPGVSATPEDEWPKHDWTRAVEVGETSPTRMLRIVSPEELSASLLASVGALRADEQLLLQWVVSPTAPARPPSNERPARSDEFGLGRFMGRSDAEKDEIAERRAKLSEPNLMAVLRVAARAATPARAEHLISNVKHSLASVHSPNNRFRKRLVLDKQLKQRVEHASGSVIFPAQLSASELASLIAWPLGRPYVAGLPQSRTRHMPAMATVPESGLVLGTSNMPGNERDVAVSYVDALTHIHVAGPTSAGKTTLLANMGWQTMNDGYGLVLLETKGDLFRAMLDRVPRHRLDDVIVWDLDDTDWPVGFNVLEQGSSRSAVDELSALIASIYPEGGVITPLVMYHGMHALASTPGGTMIDLPTILTPQSPEEGAWREHLIGNLTNKDIKKYWQRYLNANAKEQDRESAPLHRRLWQFSARPEVRNSLGQSTSSFQMSDVVASGKILLVNLNGVRIGQQTASIVGTLVMNALWSAVRSTPHAKPVYLYMDEFQNFVKLPTSPADMLAQSRSFGLGMVLAHQHTGQLQHELRDAVLANARTKIVFQTTANDARVMAGEYGTQVRPEDFMNLGRYEAIVKVATSAGVSPPVTLVTKPPSRESGHARKVRLLSRQRYGRPVAQVEAEIEARRRVDVKRGPRPKIGRTDWSE